MKETTDTLLRFYTATHAHGWQNIVGGAAALAGCGRALHNAGWGTDQVNDDPAMGLMAISLHRLCGGALDTERYLHCHKALGELRAKLEAQGYAFD